MRQFIDVTGKTEDEAIQNALRQLGLDRDDVSVEILERAKSGFLGLGSCPAKVRVSYGPEEEEEAPAAPASEEAVDATVKSIEDSVARIPDEPAPEIDISPVMNERAPRQTITPDDMTRLFNMGGN